MAFVEQGTNELAVNFLLAKDIEHCIPRLAVAIELLQKLVEPAASITCGSKRTLAGA